MRQLSGQERLPRGGAEGAIHKSPCKSDSLAGETIEVWSLRFLVTVGAIDIGSVIIGDQYEDIRTIRPQHWGAENACKEEKHQSNYHFHVTFRKMDYFLQPRSSSNPVSTSTRSH
jgi:hypothetical protein